MLLAVTGTPARELGVSIGSYYRGQPNLPQTYTHTYKVKCTHTHIPTRSNARAHTHTYKITLQSLTYKHTHIHAVMHVHTAVLHTWGATLRKNAVTVRTSLANTISTHHHRAGLRERERLLCVCTPKPTKVMPGSSFGSHSNGCNSS